MNVYLKDAQLMHDDIAGFRQRLEQMVELAGKTADTLHLLRSDSRKWSENLKLKELIPALDEAARRARLDLLVLDREQADAP